MDKSTSKAESDDKSANLQQKLSKALMQLPESDFSHCNAMAKIKWETINIDGVSGDNLRKEYKKNIRSNKSDANDERDIDSF